LKILHSTLIFGGDIGTHFEQRYEMIKNIPFSSMKNISQIFHRRFVPTLSLSQKYSKKIASLYDIEASINEKYVSLS